jgi:hypothetical protein
MVSVDAGPVIYEVVVPLPLAGGGYAHRVVWIQSITDVEDIVFVADDSSGSFGTPQVLASGGYYNYLSAATDPAGDSMVEWQGSVTSGNEGNAAFLPAAGTIPAPVLEPDPGLFNVANVIPVTLGGVSGFGILGYSGLSLNMKLFANGMLVDAGLSGYVVPWPDAGSCASCIGTPSYVVAVPCGIADLAGNDGFCIAGTLLYGNQTNLFVAAISTAGTSPTLAALQVVVSDESLSVLGLPGILAMPPASPPGPTPVTLFWEKSDDAHTYDTVFYAQFTSLTSAPSPILFLDAGYNGGSLVTVGPTLLPWRGAPLAINPSADVHGSFWQSWVLPPGVAVPPPDLRLTYDAALQGYVDPVDGGLVIAPNRRANFASDVTIFGLAP